MKSLTTQTARSLIVCTLLLLLPGSIHASEPNTKDLDTAINSGDFAGYSTKISAWLDTRVPADPGGISEATLKALLKDPVFAKTLSQRQFISKAGAGTLAGLVKGDESYKAFLAWILKNTDVMENCMEGVTPVALGKRASQSYSIPLGSLHIWKRIYDADPESRKGIYLKLAIATGQSPPGTGNRGAGQAKNAADPVDRYEHFKAAHKNGELFPSFDHLSVWEYRQIVSSNASNADLAWAREMINTWRPDLRINERVVNSTSEVWRRNSPVPFNDTFKNVLAGGGKCGPRSSWAVFICQAFGLPAIGIRQPRHACAAYKTAYPHVEPQPGNAWKVVYGRGWHVSKTWWGSGPEFMEAMKARSHAPEFSQIERLRWLASTLTSEERAAAVMEVAGKIANATPADGKAGQKVRVVDAASGDSKTESPFKPVPGVIHVEAESFANIFGVRVLDCFTGGKQVNFQKNMESSWIEYSIDAPATGTYGLTLRIATPNFKQVLDVSSGGAKLATVKVPNTTGLWGTTEQVDVKLNQGKQLIRFSAPYQRGIAVRWFELKSK